MTTVSKAREKSGPATIELESVRLQPRSECLSFSLDPGELLCINCPRDSPVPDLWDLLVGLEVPCDGRIRFAGSTWESRSEKQRQAARLTVGSVFTGENKHEAPWLENLDIDENVVLAQMMNPARNRVDIEKRLKILLEDFGIERLPGLRPASVSPQQALLAQWVRAFLPDPLRLLILKEPMQWLPNSAQKRLLARMDQARKEEGTAVVWIDEGRSNAEVEALRPTKVLSELPLGFV